MAGQKRTAADTSSGARLKTYRAKRDPAKTPEPMGGADDAGGAGGPGAARFVIQEHHARALHWDFRLERDGVLVSWALPKGLPVDPKTNHLAVHTEDHPLEYGGFEGDIPKGEYGGGHVDIWDRGTYELEKWTDREVKVVLHGTKAEGRYVLFPTGGKNWMIHRMDPAPEGFEPMPERIAPMLALAGTMPDGRRRLGLRVQVGRRARPRLRRGRPGPRHQPQRQGPGRLVSRACGPSESSWALGRPSSTARSSPSTSPAVRTSGACNSVCTSGPGPRSRDAAPRSPSATSPSTCSTSTASRSSTSPTTSAGPCSSRSISPGTTSRPHRRSSTGPAPTCSPPREAAALEGVVAKRRDVALPARQPPGRLGEDQELPRPRRS